MEFSGEEFAESMDVLLTPEPEKSRKGGRPTIRDNFLLGSRNQWRSFFETCWPEVGWTLLQIRKRRTSTIEDVRKVFEPLKGNIRCNLADMFLRGSPQRIAIRSLRAKRIASNTLRHELQGAQRERPNLQHSLSEAEGALTTACERDKPAIQVQILRRRDLLRRNEETSASKERECVALETEANDGETYVYCSELLDFLRGGRRALHPKNLANALAGLPDMRWRQSEVRCSRMREGHFPQHPYRVFTLIERIIRRISEEFRHAPVDSFRTELLNLPKRASSKLEFLCEKWRDLRLAIEEVSQAKHESGFIPYGITSAFLRNVGCPKTSVDNVLDAEENLTLTRKVQVPAPGSNSVK